MTSSIESATADQQPSSENARVTSGHVINLTLKGAVYLAPQNFWIIFIN